jgi:hypothetical protein
MKVIIAGSRSITSINIQEIVDASDFSISTLISGGAKGIDTIAEEWANAKNIPIIQFLPDWSIGKAAGPARNLQMIRAADAMIAIWDGKSKGTASAIKIAEKHGLKIFKSLI